MVDSGPGRTELAEIGDGRVKPRRLAESKDREVRKPRPPLPLVDTALLEPRVQVGREPGCPGFRVVEDEHSHAPGLAVCPAAKADWLDRSRDGVSQVGGDAGHVGGRPAPEKGERDVDVRAWDRSGIAVTELTTLPLE